MDKALLRLDCKQQGTKPKQTALLMRSYYLYGCW